VVDCVANLNFKNPSSMCDYRITVHLHTILQRQTSEGLQRKLELGLAQGTSLADLLARLEIELSPEAMLLVVNGRIVDLTYELKDGDIVNLMPALSGG
jgi:molybdopterin converting factor small subunit